MSRKTAAKLAVREALIELVTQNRAFREAVHQDCDLPSWIMCTDDTEKNDDRLKAAEASTRLTYSDLQNKQETVRLHGVVGISPQTVTVGAQLNATREQFKSTMSEFRKLFGDSLQAIEEASDDLRDSVLSGLKIKHIHFVQSYRQLRLLVPAPKRIGFSWAAHHSGTVRLTAKEAIEHLQKKYLNSSAIRNDIEILGNMPTKETVVIRRELCPHLRANLTWPDSVHAADPQDGKRRFPAQINTPLPIFVQLNPGEPLPEFNRIKPYNAASKQERLTRSDARLVKISDNPFSRIYRYK